MDTYYNPIPHFGYNLALAHSPQVGGRVVGAGRCWLAGWVGGWVNGWVGKWVVDGWVSVGWVGGWMDVGWWVGEWVDVGWLGGWVLQAAKPTGSFARGSLEGYNVLPFRPPLAPLPPCSCAPCPPCRATGATSAKARARCCKGSAAAGFRCRRLPLPPAQRPLPRP